MFLKQIENIKKEILIIKRNKTEMLELKSKRTKTKKLTRRDKHQI